METSKTDKLPYQLTYWFNPKTQIAAVRVSDTMIQCWQALGNEFDKDFKHTHVQSTYPSKERLDEALAQFEPSDIDKYLEVQFKHHSMDDYFRQKANAVKDKLFQMMNSPAPGGFKNLNPPPMPPKQQSK